MRASSWVFLLRAACLVALGTSVALLIDYTRADPSFCGLDSGCGAVRHSGLGYIPLGVGSLPVPAVGVLGFALLFASTLQRSAATRGAVSGPFAYAAALVAIGLIVLQAVLGHFCSLCLAVDACGIVVGICAFALRGPGWEEAQKEEESRPVVLDTLELTSEGQRVKGVWREDSQVYAAPNPLVRRPQAQPFRLRLSTWLSLAAVAVLAPAGYPWLVRQSDVPGVIRALYSNDGVTVLEFFDFQCPHCQDLSPRLKALVDEHPRLILRYGYAPLPGNPGSRDAARATICAGEQGKEQDVALAFFGARRFDKSHIREVAEGIVPNGRELAECLASKRPDERIAADTSALQSAGFVGLPTTYVGGIRILGAEDDIVYRDAFHLVLEGRDTSGLSPLSYWLGILLILGALVMKGRIKSGDVRAAT